MPEKIKLFVLDIDGCISHPFQTPHWESISQIRNLNLQSRNEDHIPSLTLCTGRPLPYAEAVAQWLDIRHPFVFESAALYHPVTNRIHTEVHSRDLDSKSRNNGEPDFERMYRSEDFAPIEEFKEWLSESILPEFPGTILEFTKMLDAGVVSPDKKQIDIIHEKIMKQVRDHYPGLEVHRTDVSVNTLLAGNNKGRGIELISREMDIPLNQMAYIGDSEGDLMALQRVKMSFAPSNAIKRVRDISEEIQKETSEAVLEAYRRIISRNRNGSSDS